MRNAWLQDNIPVQVGFMAACPDGKGFNVTFEHFKVKHLPDQRRLEWLKKNAEQLIIAGHIMYALIKDHEVKEIILMR